MIELERAVKLWNAGLTMTQIGKELSLTKGQVARRIADNRDLFSRRVDPIKRLEAEIAGEVIAPVTPKPRGANLLRKMFSEASAPAPRSKANDAAYDQERLQYAVTMADLDTRKCCRWPITSFEKGNPNLFCAEVKAGKNYCKIHAERQWRVG
jgi:hypothetical protein